MTHDPSRCACFDVDDLRYLDKEAANGTAGLDTLERARRAGPSEAALIAVRERSLALKPMRTSSGRVQWVETMVRSELAGIAVSEGALIVVDETFTGLHRTGPCWGFMRYGFVPDVIVVGKALMNGLSPLSELPSDPAAWTGIWETKGRDELR